MYTDSDSVLLTISHKSLTWTEKSIVYCIPTVCLLTSIYSDIGNVTMLVGTLGHVKFKVGKPVITGTLVMIGRGWGTIWQGSGPGLGVGR